MTSTIERQPDGVERTKIVVKKESGLRVWWRKYNVGTHLLILIVMFIVLLPIIWLISTSFKDLEEFYSNPS